MIPAPTSEKDDEISKSRYQTIVGGKSEGIGGDTYYGYKENLYDEVVSRFRDFGCPVDGKRVLLHKGLFEETWPSFTPDHIALVHIDCDWYDPVKFCLDSVKPKMSAGGMVVIDDYHAYGGARVATDEFVVRNRDSVTVEDGENVILRFRPPEP